VELIEVTYAYEGSLVTSVDTGISPLAYEADGSQINPYTNVAYPVGTLLINDENGIPRISQIPYLADGSQLNPHTDEPYPVGTLLVNDVYGIPQIVFMADGSQIDPTTNAPYPVGTLLVTDLYGVPYPVGSNKLAGPIITENSTQTWAINTQPLRRESLIFDRPTKFGRFKQPIDWAPTNIISADWGVIQIIIDGIDVTYFRGVPAEMGPWSSNEPNGDAAASIFFSQISWWERPAHNDLTWTRPGSDVTVQLVRPDGSTKVLFEGILVAHKYSGQGVGVSYDILGVLYQADHTPYIQELYKKKRDIGTAIADIMDGTVSRHFGLCNRPVTGIITDIRGSGGGRLTQGVQDILSTAWTADIHNQWTITNEEGRKPVIKLKDRDTHHWTMAMGHPGLELDITNDTQNIVSMIWGSGTGPEGDSWFNAKYPGIRIEEAPAYPQAAGSTFTAGDGSTGFDEFADEMRTRGYTMYSGDTYDPRDVDEVKDAQRRAGIQVDGVVGAQTWNALFGVGGNHVSLKGAHIAPIAAVTDNMEFLYRVDGSIIGPNPAYDRSRLAIGRLIEYGEVSKAQGRAFANREIQPAREYDPQWVGSATINMDPEEGSRWEMRAGQNLFVKYFHPPLMQLAEGVDGLLLHMSQVSVTPGGSVTAQLSYLAHDMTTLSALMKRNKSTIDPARRTNQNSRSSKVHQDRIIPWDSEAGGGKIPVHNLQGGLWTTFPIPAGELGTINKTMYVCATTLSSSVINTAFLADGSLPGGKRFCVAVFNKPVTANWLASVVGNPLTADDIWSKKAPQLEAAGLIQAFGTTGQAAGYWPGQETKTDPITGKMLDGATWPWESKSAPYLFIAEFCEASTKIAGLLRNAPFGT